MTAGPDIGGSGDAILKVNRPGLTTHDRSHLVAVRQAECMAEFVCRYIKEHLMCVSTATGLGRVELDYYRQANDASLISVDFRFTHLVTNVRGATESDQDVRALFIRRPCECRFVENLLEDFIPLCDRVVNSRVHGWQGRGLSIYRQRKTLPGVADHPIFDASNVGAKDSRGSQGCRQHQQRESKQQRAPSPLRGEGARDNSDGPAIWMFRQRPVGLRLMPF
jgi:hypothetical protein